MFTFLIVFNCLGQEMEDDVNKDDAIYVQILSGIAFPAVLGTNFLSKAYEVKSGFTGELLIFLNDRYFIGYQGVFNSYEVENTSLVGRYDKGAIRHNYVMAGYSFISKNNELGVATALGLGYANYKNKKGNTIFFDNGFSIMANTRITYRFSKYFGLFAGVQVSNDFLTIETAPEINDFFKEARTLYFSTGLVLYIGT